MTVTHELPYYSKYLLCAAYLASFNPARQDTIYFTKASEKKRKKKGGATAVGRVPKHRKVCHKIPTDILASILTAPLDPSPPSHAVRLSPRPPPVHIPSNLATRSRSDRGYLHADCNLVLTAVAFEVWSRRSGPPRRQLQVESQLRLRVRTRTWTQR